jgi:hypothetical protein
MIDWREFLSLQWARDARVDEIDRKLSRLAREVDGALTPAANSQSLPGPTVQEPPWEWSFLSRAEKERWRREGGPPKNW